ncbi:hypothetical protein [Devosia sp. 2618]|uniref:hypothetical protein n=1 Tax=Devosia sp. 2618 TaxID=3156454 RepID=UPI003393D70D
MKLPLAVAATLALVLPAQADVTGLKPEQIGEIFCLAVQASDMEALAGLQTPDLSAAIADAEVKNTAYEAAHPGDKPPLGNGIPWQTWMDVADTCTVGAIEMDGDTARIPIVYVFDTSPSANYTDHVLLRIVPVEGGWRDAWRIDDIALEDTTLRETLINFFKP